NERGCMAGPLGCGNAIARNVRAASATRIPLHAPRRSRDLGASENTTFHSAPPARPSAYQGHSKVVLWEGEAPAEPGSPPARQEPRPPKTRPWNDPGLRTLRRIGPQGGSCRVESPGFRGPGGAVSGAAAVSFQDVGGVDEHGEIRANRR